MYADFEKLVLEDYQRKKRHNVLSAQLSHPTPAKIKKECVRLCKEEMQKMDEKVVRDFCEEWDSRKTYLQNIDSYDVDKFRPLSNFLKGETESTDPKNIHLLAWLIDFPYRPFEFGKKYVLLTERQAWGNVPESVVDPAIDNTFLSENKPDTEVEVEGIVAVGNNISPMKPKWKFPRVAIVGVWLAFVGTGGYWWWDITRPQGNVGCMYWTGDHFQQIPCNQKIPNTLVVGLDSVRVKNFKKITRPDTISHLSKGYIWYSKIDNKIEFFTAGGEHPVVIGRRLKPITDYIIDKYIHPDTASK